MALFRGLGARKDATRGTVPLEVRKLLAGLFTPVGGIGARSGILIGADSPLVTGNATYAYNVGVFHAYVSRAASDGGQLYGNDGSVLIGATGVGSTVPVAPTAGLQRIDIIWTRHQTNTENADTASDPLFGVASGASAVSAIAPAIPAGAIELARNLMTSAATTTLSAGNTITQSALYTALRNAPVPVRNQTERDAMALFNGLQVYRLDTAVVETYNGTAWVAPTVSIFGLFAKADQYSTAFKTTGLGTAQIKAGTYVDVNGTLITFAVDTTITMPALTAGTNYFIYVSTAGVIQAVAASGTWPTPVAAPPANSRLIGGFHYAMGSNAAAQAGGDTTAQINAYSFWDLKWKPAALDSRGMTLVNNQFWADIYLLNTNPQVNGTSSYNQQIADGASLAIIPTAFGGNGATTYAIQDWWSTAECLQAFQKRLPKYAEFQALAYGTTENTSQGTDPVNTIGSGGRNAYTSKWGIILATGNMDVWGADFGGPYAAAGWVNNNGGRGQTYDLPNAVLFGGGWGYGVDSGSRDSYWNNAPTAADSVIGGRGVCDHLALV